MKRTYASSLGVSLLAVACWASGAEPRLSLRAAQEVFVIGEPVELSCAVENTGSTPIQLWASLYKAREEAIPGFKVEVRDVTLNEDVTTKCHEYESTYNIVVGKGESHPQTITLQPGESIVQVLYSPYLLTCPVDKLRPHAYEIRASLSTSGVSLPKEIWQGTVSSNVITIRLVEPQGEEKAYLEELVSCLNAQIIKRPPLSNNPLMVREVTSIAIPSLLAAHPTSTYTGYVLAHSAPTYALWPFTCLGDPDGALRKFSDMGGGEENIRLRIEAAQADMRSYARNAASFLRVHPDFVYAPLIRKMYAMCLGLTGHLSEAIAEVRLLADGTGKEAEEAKAFLTASGYGEIKSTPGAASSGVKEGR